MVEVIINKGLNLDKETLFSLVKEIRYICSNLSLSDVKDKIIKGIPIPMESKYSVSEELLEFLKKNKIDTIIKYDSQKLSINEFTKKMEDEEEESFNEDDEDFDKEEYKGFILYSFTKEIINNIEDIITEEKLVTKSTDDFSNGKLIAYNNVIKLLREEY